MIQTLAYVPLIVRDYDEAIEFYCGKLGFRLVEDTQRKDKRWVRIRPQSNQGSDILLSKAVNEKQLASVGNQTGGRVLFFFHTDNFDSDYKKFRSLGIEFTEGPFDQPFGKVGIFLDLYGNRIDLIEPKDP